MSTRADFEETIRSLTKPLNGQFPRPWMTNLLDPLTADVFIVGKNQRNGYPVDMPGGHNRHLDALFNRAGQSCRGLYDELTGGRASPTRKNTDRFVSMLRAEGVERTLETNVICYSSPMSADLKRAAHHGGALRGAEIFNYLLQAIAPHCIVVHGAGARDTLSRVLRIPLAQEPERGGSPSFVDAGALRVYSIPSLAPPAHNRWIGWADQHLGCVARDIAGRLRRGEKAG